MAEKGITKVADMTNSVTTVYEKEYLLHAIANPGVWAQFIDWQDPIPEDGGGGSSWNIPVYGETDLAEETIAEDEDITPEKISDGYVTITPYEWGKTFGLTKKLKYQSRVKQSEVMGKLVDMNRVRSIDRVLRRSACGIGATYPTMTIHIDGSAAMSSLTAASGADNVTFAFLQELQAQAQSLDIEPFDNGEFKAIIHPLLALDIKQLTEWKSMGYYAGDKENIYGYNSKPFSLAGITFIPSNMGRLYLGSGTVAQAATTCTAAMSKGATTVPVAEQTGIVAGTYITIGTLESESVSPGTNLEQVYVTAAAGASGAGNLTVRGNGVGEDFGLRFDHASGESVVESYNVAAIPIIGKNSLLGKYGSDVGRYGIAKRKEGLDLLDRFTYFGWYWYGGVGIVQKHLMLGKCSVSKWTTGYN